MIAPKFKIGDLVIGNEKANSLYAMTREGYIGKVQRVSSNGRFIRINDHDGLYADAFDLYNYNTLTEGQKRYLLEQAKDNYLGSRAYLIDDTGTAMKPYAAPVRELMWDTYGIRSVNHSNGFVFYSREAKWAAWQKSMQENLNEAIARYTIGTRYRCLDSDGIDRYEAVVTRTPSIMAENYIDAGNGFIYAKGKWATILNATEPIVEAGQIRDIPVVETGLYKPSRKPLKL